MGENLPSSFGFAKYSTDSEGIGGMLKTRVSDFRVDEESKKIKLDSKGRFTLARITLTNWDTNRFVNLMAKRLRISRNRIWFAGTKDKRAVTSQLFVIDSPQTKVANIEIDRKILADLAVNDEEAFRALTDKAKLALEKS